MELPFIDKVAKFKKSFRDKTGVRFQPWPLLAACLTVLAFAFLIMPEAVALAFSMALFVAPVWLPFMLIGGAWLTWMIFIQAKFISTRKYILLEIKPPRNLVKTPLAMEAFLSGIHLYPGIATWYARSIMGRVRPWWSLEVASFEGQVHFYIWSREEFRRIIESQMYAQYPGVQLVEVPDYMRQIDAVPEKYTIWGCDYIATAADPLPIKTYVEFGLDKVQKEPEQVDPLANLLEFMSSLGKGEQVWLQIMIRVHKGEKYNKLNKDGKPYTVRDEGLDLIDKIRKEARNPYTDPATGEERPGFPNPTKGESEKMAAIDRNTSKLNFDTGIRCVYIAEPEHYRSDIVMHMTGLFKPFWTEGWNGIWSTHWMKKFDDYPWELFGTQALKNKYIRKLVELTRRRQYFHDPYGYGLFSDQVMVSSVEELATIFHIPSASVEAPGLKRLQSATGQAPPNLPL